MQSELSPVIDFAQLSDLVNLSLVLRFDDLLPKVCIEFVFHVEDEVINELIRPFLVAKTKYWHFEIILVQVAQALHHSYEFVPVAVQGLRDHLFEGKTESVRCLER